MDPIVANALIAGAFGVVGLVIGGWVKGRQFKAERYREREQSFERAQAGYRACYRKLEVNLAAVHGVGAGFQERDGSRKAVDFAVLQENFLEAKGCGDPVVIEELDTFWPREVREHGEPPPQSLPESLEAAMRAHGSRTLTEHEQLVARHKARGDGALAAAG
ncbi:MAG TPA: hypothetical protein VGW80_04960 [Solirubrobacterales bacterium]|jgi:hypothetical protein|nr:hypothetical protein [Solirubrobacterales bacterium]